MVCGSSLPATHFGEKYPTTWRLLALTHFGMTPQMSICAFIAAIFLYILAIGVRTGFNPHHPRLLIRTLEQGITSGVYLGEEIAILVRSTLVQLMSTITKSHQAWTISTVVVDVTITAFMMAIVSAGVPDTITWTDFPFQLYHAKASAYYEEMRNKISRMLRLTIQTGFLTSILAIPIVPMYNSKIPGWNLFTYVMCR